jgi:hypothetical protein
VCTWSSRWFIEHQNLIFKIWNGNTCHNLFTSVYVIGVAYMTSIYNNEIIIVQRHSYWIMARSGYKDMHITLREHLSSPRFFGGIRVSFLYCPIMWLYVLIYALWCLLQFPHNSDVRFVFTSGCLWEGSCLIYVIYACLRVVVSNTYCVVMFALFVFVLCLVRPILPYCNLLFISPLVFSNAYVHPYAHLRSNSWRRWCVSCERGSGIKCLYVLGSVLWYVCYDFRIKRCLVPLYLQLIVRGIMSYLRYLCLFAHSGVQHIVVSNTYCVVFFCFFVFFPFFVSVSSYVVSCSGLSIFDWSFRVF